MATPRDCLYCTANGAPRTATRNVSAHRAGTFGQTRHVHRTLCTECADLLAADLLAHGYTVTQEPLPVVTPAL